MPSGVARPLPLPPLCTFGVCISRSPETPTGWLTTTLCAIRSRRALKGKPEGSIACCRSFWFCWWIFARIPEVELCVCSISSQPHFEPFSFPVRFWGWTENEREAARDLTELRARAQNGLPLYGESDQPEWVQHSAYNNSAWSQLKFRESLHLTPRNIHLSLVAVTEAFPMFVPVQPALEGFSLTDTPGSTSSTTNITVQTNLSTRSKCTGRAPHNISLCSASFPSVLFLPVHARPFVVLHQLVDNTLPHCVIDRLGFP